MHESLTRTGDGDGSKKEESYVAIKPTWNIIHFFFGALKQSDKVGWRISFACSDLLRLPCRNENRA